MDTARAHQEFQRTRFFPGLDGLRCLSIVLVVAYHVSGMHSGFLGRGYLGVALFFAISGFLITTLLLREQDSHGQISLGRFYARRSLRIFPLYYAVLGIYVVLVLFTEKGVQEKTEFFTNLPAFLTYTSNWFVPLVPDKRIIFYFAWSLATEEQFYLLWPGVMRMARRGGAVVFMAGLLAISLWAPWAVETGRLDDSLLWVRILASFAPPICMGCLAAYAVHTRQGFAWVYRVLGHTWVPPAALALVLAAVATDGVPFGLTSLLMTALVVSCCISTKHPLMPVLTFSWIRYVGTVSYGVYLLHMLALNLVRRLVPGQGMAVYLPLTLGLSVLLAGLSYRYFESWFLRLKDRLGAGPAPAPRESPSPAAPASSPAP
ncbi:acyltransferase family protein [Hyalangium rubrum]|uniref:Acyltransferase n=1 Tax=Hyalangium rubrum TaxID=3103134 RepID=A0ABU5GY45_9BACT|nr:acyltransferase [Hyalangium sp. s54d21]MDY7226001.1 acyltransferase [Hyalangium sp. s54d21]